MNFLRRLFRRKGHQEAPFRRPDTCRPHLIVEAFGMGDYCVCLLCRTEAYPEYFPGYQQAKRRGRVITNPTEDQLDFGRYILRANGRGGTQ